jgi:GntR family transcriptional regulator
MSTLTKPTIGLLRTNGTSLHRQLFLVLREQVGRGAYAPGAALPTEEALCQQFGVSRITVRRALRDLEGDGLVERRHGRGTFVREGGLPLESPPRLTLTEGLRRIAVETQVELLEAGKKSAPAAIASLLHLTRGADAVYALRLRKSGDVPLMVTEAWLPDRFVNVATPAALRRLPLFELLLHAGVKFGRVVQEMSAEAADPLRARLLETSIGAPLIRVARLLHDASAQPVQHLTVHMSPERSRILMDIPTEDVDTLGAGYVAHDVLPPLRSQAKRSGHRHPLGKTRTD